MADHSSIASRMQKLAKLKRRKSGGDAVADPEPEDVNAAEPDSPEEDSAPILMSGPTLQTSDDRDESPVSGSDDADSPAVSEEEPSGPAGAPDEDEESLDDYFAALGMEPSESASDGEVPTDSADAILDSAEEAESEAARAAEVEATQEAEADDVLDEINLGVIDDDNTDDIDDILAAAEAAEADAERESQAGAGIETPDFAQTEIDPETLAREFEDEVAAARKAAESDDESLVSVTFDESRSTLLNHVSRQMNCSVDDVVVTALDWYLDALFGEDEQQAEATG